MAFQYNASGEEHPDYSSDQNQRPLQLSIRDEVWNERLSVPESPKHGQAIGNRTSLPGSPRYESQTHGSYGPTFPPDENVEIYPPKTTDDFSAKSDPYVRLSQAKCVLLGSVAAGKTSLLNALRYGEPRLAPEGPDGRTIGIEVHSVAVRPDTKLWFYDFGGHDTYHFSQQLFLTQRAIYLIAVDVSIYDKVKVDKTIRHWFTILTSRLVSPVICLLATHIDECHDKEEMYRCCLEMSDMLGRMDEMHKQKLENEMSALKAEIMEENPDPDVGVRRFQPRTLRQPIERLNLLLRNRPRIFHKVCCISSKTFEGMDEFREDLVSIVTENESLFPQKDVPRSWIALADAIVSKKEDVPFVTINEFIELAQEFSVVGDYVQKALIYLQSVGLVLHYQDYRQNSELSKYVFVNPNLLLAIFGLVFNHNYFMDETRFVWKHKSILRLPHYDFVHLRKNLKERGVIGEKLLKCFWDAMGISDEVYQAIVPLLEKFDLCYEIRLKPGEAVVEGRHFLFPYLLNKKKPPEIKFMWSEDLLDNFMQCGVELNFTTPNLPFGFLEKVLVRAHTYVDHCLSWKQGMVAFCDEGQDLVRIEAKTDTQGNALLTISARVRVDRRSMARHIILLLVAVTNRVLLHHYPGVVAYWYCLCAHCISKMLAQKYSEVKVDRFPADNIVYTAAGDPLKIHCINCRGQEYLSLEQVFPVSSEDVNNLKRLMSEPCCRALKASEPALLKHMNYRDVMNALLRKQLLTIKQAESIGSKPNHEERTQQLLSFLPNCDHKAFEVLCFELKQSKETAWLADELTVRASGINKKSQEAENTGSGFLRMSKASGAGWRGSQSSQDSQGARSISSGTTWSSYSRSSYGYTGSYIRRPYGSYIQRESSQDYSKRPSVNYTVRSQNTASVKASDSDSVPKADPPPPSESRRVQDKVPKYDTGYDPESSMTVRQLQEQRTGYDIHNTNKDHTLGGDPTAQDHHKPLQQIDQQQNQEHIIKTSEVIAANQYDGSTHLPIINTISKQSMIKVTDEENISPVAEQSPVDPSRTGQRVNDSQIESGLESQIVLDVPVISQEVVVTTSNFPLTNTQQESIVNESNSTQEISQSQEEVVRTVESLIIPDTSITSNAKEKKKSGETKKKRRKRPKGSKIKTSREPSSKEDSSKSAISGDKIPESRVDDVKDVPDTSSEIQSKKAYSEDMKSRESFLPVQPDIIESKSRDPLNVSEAETPNDQHIEVIPSSKDTLLENTCSEGLMNKLREDVSPEIPVKTNRPTSSSNEEQFLSSKPTTKYKPPLIDFHGTSPSPETYSKRKSPVAQEQPVPRPVAESTPPKMNHQARPPSPVPFSLKDSDVEIGQPATARPIASHSLPKFDPQTRPALMELHSDRKGPGPQADTLPARLVADGTSTSSDVQARTDSYQRQGPGRSLPTKTIENRVKSTGDIADHMKRGDVGYGSGRRPQIQQQKQQSNVLRSQNDVYRHKARSVADLIGAADLGPQHMLHEMDPIELPSWSIRRSRSSLSLSFRRAKSKSPKPEKKEQERHTWAVPYDWEQHQSCETLNKDSMGIDSKPRRQGSGIIVTSSTSDIHNEPTRMRPVSGPARVQSQPVLHGETKRYSMPRPTRKESNTGPPAPRPETMPQPAPQFQSDLKRGAAPMQKRQPPPKEIALPRPRPSGVRITGKNTENRMMPTGQEGLQSRPSGQRPKSGYPPVQSHERVSGSLQLPQGINPLERKSSDSSELTDSFHTGRSLSESDFFSDATLQSGTSGVTIDSYHTTRSHAPSIGSRALSHTSHVSDRTIESYHSVRSQALSNSDFPDDATITSDISELTIDSFHTINSEATPTGSPCTPGNDTDFTMVSQMSDLTMDSFKSFNKSDEDDVTLTSGSSPEPFATDGTPNREPFQRRRPKNDPTPYSLQEVPRRAPQSAGGITRPPNHPPPPPPSQQYRPPPAHAVTVEENAPPVPPRKDLQGPPPLPNRPPNASIMPARPRVTFADDYDANGELKVGAQMESRVKEARTVPLPKTDPQWSPSVQSASAYQEKNPEPMEKEKKMKKSKSKKKGTKKSKKTLLPYVGSTIPSPEHVGLAKRDAEFSSDGLPEMPARRNLDQEFNVQTKPDSFPITSQPADTTRKDMAHTYAESFTNEPTRPVPVHTQIYSLHAQQFMQQNLDHRHMRADAMAPTNGAKPHAYVQPYVRGSSAPWPLGANNNTNNGNFKESDFIGTNGNGMVLVEEPYLPSGGEANANMIGINQFGVPSRYVEAPSTYPQHQPRTLMVDNSRAGSIPRMGTQSPSRSDSQRREGRPGDRNSNSSQDTSFTMGPSKSREETV